MVQITHPEEGTLWKKEAGDDRIYGVNISIQKRGKIITLYRFKIPSGEEKILTIIEKPDTLIYVETPTTEPKKYTSLGSMEKGMIYNIYKIEKVVSRRGCYYRILASGMGHFEE